MRCLLAILALIIVWIDPPDPLDYAGITYVSLLGFCAYSVAICASVFRGRPLLPPRFHPWIDVAVSAYLVSLSQGISSIFFHFFFFAILAASFTRGFREGFGVTIVSTLLFVAVGVAAAPRDAAFELDRALIRPVYLLVLGFMIAYWGGHEILLRRRLSLLKDIGSFANPRLGVDPTIALHMRRLVSFFEADGCVLICTQPSSPDFKLYRMDASLPQVPVAPAPLSDRSADALLQLPAGLAIAFCAEDARRKSMLFPRPAAWGGHSRRVGDGIDELCRRLANLLETTHFVAVPYRQHQGPPGRLYLIGGKSEYTQSDADFLCQVVDQIATAVDNLALLDELMVNAARLERSRISRDIHDTTIQPYIGLKIGLEALHRGLVPGSPVEKQVKELIDMSGSAVADLRAYVANLRGGNPGWPGDNLLASLRDQIQHYRDFYGIEIHLQGNPDMQFSGRIAAEVYQIVCEALSNVYRHTASKQARVELRCDAHGLDIEVANLRQADKSRPAFMPRSIAERASSLGGATEVKLDQAGYDVVRVRIPL